MCRTCLDIEREQATRCGPRVHFTRIAVRENKQLSYSLNIFMPRINPHMRTCPNGQRTRETMSTTSLAIESLRAQLYARTVEGKQFPHVKPLISHYCSTTTL